MSTEKFCLRWNDFESNISVAFRELRDDKDFFDVTLACDDEQISAHKVILSACSPFFRNILRRNPHQHPLLYLKGVKYTDLQSVLNFMYNGEVNVAQEELNSFLAVAEELRVKGLTQNQGGSQSRAKSPPVVKSHHRPPVERDPPSLPKRPKPNPQPQNSYVQDDDIQEVVPVKTEPRDPQTQPMPSYPTPSVPVPSPSHVPPPPSQTHAVAPMEDSMAHYEEQYDDYGQYEDQNYGGIDTSMAGAEGNKDYGNGFGADEDIQSPDDLKKFVMQDPVSKVRYCSICNNYSHKALTNVRDHVESKHYNTHFIYNCERCAKQFPTKMALFKHKPRCKFNIIQ